MNTLRILLAVLVVTLGAGNGRAASFTAPITGTGGLSGTVTGSYSFAYPLVLSGTNVTATATITNNDSRALQTLGSGFTNRNTNARLVAESAGGGSANLQIADPDFFGLFSTAQLGFYWTNTAGQIFFYGSSDAGNTVANVATFSPTNIFFNTNVYAGTLNADDRITTVRKASELTAHPSSEGYEFWDDFNRTVTNSPGVSPSGHTWGFSSASGVNSNVVFVQDGAFKIATNAQAGATYWGVTNSNPNTVWNKFKGSFLYREYDANGFRQNLGFILANNYFRGGTNWLHVGINQNGFYVQRELADFFINELFATELETDIEHTYEILLSDDKLWARVAGHYYFLQNDALTNYTSFPVVIYEHNMKMTNRPAQYFGEWLSAAAGQFESPIVNMAKPFSYSSNATGVSSIRFSDGSIQTTAGGGGGGTNNPIRTEGPQNTLIANQTSRSQWSTNQSFAFTLAVGSSNQSSITSTHLQNTSTNTIYASNSFSVFHRQSGSNVSVFPILPSSTLRLYAELNASNVWEVEAIGAEFALEPDGTTITSDTNYTTGKITLTAVGAASTTNRNSLNVSNAIRYGQVDLVATDTDPIHIDFALGNLFTLKLLTNATIVFTNVYAGLMDGRVLIQQDTNGQRTVDWSVAGGLLQTNASLQPTTNANALDLLEVTASLFSTNLLAWYPQNFQPRVPFTNSLASGTSVLPLELVSTPAAGAYSVSRLLTNAWTSALALVVRSSDGATNYLTGTSSGNNIASIVSWAGSDNVYVTNWFDQSGKGRHAVQGDTNLCWVIVTNGVAVNNGGVTVAKRVGANAHAVALSVALNEPVSGIVSVYNSTKTAGDVIVGGSGTSRQNLEQATGSTYRLDNTASVDSGTLTLEQWDIVSYKFLATASAPDAIAVDGGSYATGEAGSNASTSLNIGNATVGADVMIGTWIIWNADIDSTDLGNVRDNINAFQSIY